MNDLIKAIRQSYAEKALEEALWCHDALPRLTGAKWKKHYEAVMYYNLFKWSGWRE